MCQQVARIVSDIYIVQEYEESDYGISSYQPI